MLTPLPKHGTDPRITYRMPGFIFKNSFADVEECIKILFFFLSAKAELLLYIGYFVISFLV